MFRFFKSYIGTLEDKAILITGCDSGFGRLMALSYSQEGAHVYAGVLNGKNAEALEAEAETRSDAKGKITALVLNVTDEEHIQEAFKRVKEELQSKRKSLHAIINNAGVTGGWYVEFTDMSIYRRMFDINYFGSVEMTKTFLPLIANPGGRVIGVISSAGSYVMHGTSVYSSTKFAHNAFLDALRNELRDSGIHVIKVMPGGHKTEGVGTYTKVVDPDLKYSAATDDIKSRYRSTLLQEFHETVKKYQDSFGDPMNVVRAIKDALLSTNPNPSYPVGFDAWIMYGVLPMLPISWADWIQSKL